MESLKRIWARIVSAFAVPTAGPGAPGGVPLDRAGDVHPHEVDAAATGHGQWKSHGGFRK